MGCKPWRLCELRCYADVSLNKRQKRVRNRRGESQLPVVVVLNDVEPWEGAPLLRLKHVGWMKLR